jgi:hypothetical protein
MIERNFPPLIPSSDVCIPMPKILLYITPPSLSHPGDTLLHQLLIFLREP